MAEDEIIQTEEGPDLLTVGDWIAVRWPSSGGIAGEVKKVTEWGVRIEFVEWFAGTPDHEELWSWDRIFSIPGDDIRVFGDGYYFSAINRFLDIGIRRSEESGDGAGVKTSSSGGGF